MYQVWRYHLFWVPHDARSPPSDRAPRIQGCDARSREGEYLLSGAGRKKVGAVCRRWSSDSVCGRTTPWAGPSGRKTV